MEPKTDHNVPKQFDKVFTPPPTKKPGRRRLRSSGWAFMGKALGVALVIANPYIYHAFMVASYGTPIEEALLVIGPILLYLSASFIYMKGENADAD